MARKKQLGPREIVLEHCIAPDETLLQAAERMRSIFIERRPAIDPEKQLVVRMVDRYGRLIGQIFGMPPKPREYGVLRHGSDHRFSGLSYPRRKLVPADG